jgi:hypothetical protein
MQPTLILFISFFLFISLFLLLLRNRCPQRAQRAQREKEIIYLLKILFYFEKLKAFGPFGFFCCLLPSNKSPQQRINNPWQFINPLILLDIETF